MSIGYQLRESLSQKTAEPFSFDKCPSLEGILLEVKPVQQISVIKLYGSFEFCAIVTCYKLLKFTRIRADLVCS